MRLEGHPDNVAAALFGGLTIVVAAAVLLMTEEKAAALGLKPRARFVATAVISTEPTIMLTGPTAAARKAPKKAAARTARKR